MQAQGLRGVAVDGLHQGPLVAALRHPDLDPGAPQLGEPARQTVAVARAAGRHQHLARHGLGGLVAVHLQQELLDQLAGPSLLDPLDDPAALAADAAAADVEDLDGRLERVLGEGDDVGVGAVAQHDGLLLHGPLQRPDVVAQPRRPLVLLRVGGGAHLALEPPDEPAGVARP